MKLAELAKRLNSKNASGLGLPPLVLITDARRLPDPAGAAARLPRGSAVLLRDYDMAERAALARRLAEVARHRGLKLLIAGDARLAIRVGAAGIHLPEARAGEARRWRYRRQWLITVAAHSGQALRHAAMCGADAALLSPVFATASHPGMHGLGPDRFNMLAARAALPVYALGGINHGNAARLLSGRAAGIAGIAAFAGQSWY
ncbi:MAG: thiamine phosphate synthase [Alphaproteobacteria bacterium]|nr:thiamine phosphate synthase [Alphaproteobacteria bacterium]